MRIIAGSARGQPLATPRGDATRPTSDRVREAIFSSLGDRVREATVLDLFAGSGALGLEAASRGARSVTFVEQARPALQVIGRNVEQVRRHPEFAGALMVCRGDVFRELGRLATAGELFNLVLADPPYGEIAQRLLDDPNLATVLANGGVLVLESAKRDRVTPAACWRVTREAVYGDTAVQFLMAQP